MDPVLSELICLFCNKVFTLENNLPAMETGGTIIAFLEFNHAIDANLAKTKLDAYGIPCFLTEENLSNLYPGQPFAAFRVRLHLFAEDAERARQVLDGGNMQLSEDSTPRCPSCHSISLERDFPKKLQDTFLTGLRILFFGIFSPGEKIYRCRDCHHEFAG